MRWISPRVAAWLRWVRPATGAEHGNLGIGDLAARSLTAQLQHRFRHKDDPKFGYRYLVENARDAGEPMANAPPDGSAPAVDPIV
jgi:hypothetical protein